MTRKRKLLIPIEENEAIAIAQIQERFPHLSDTAAIRAIIADWLQYNQDRDVRSVADLFLAILDAFGRIEQKLGAMDSERATFDEDEMDR